MVVPLDRIYILDFLCSERKKDSPPGISKKRLIPGLVSFIGHASTFWLYGLIAIGAWIFFYKLVPETKGKTLEEIEQHWRKGKKPRELRK